MRHRARKMGGGARARAAMAPCDVTPGAHTGAAMAGTGRVLAMRARGHGAGSASMRGWGLWRVVRVAARVWRGTGLRWDLIGGGGWVPVCQAWRSWSSRAKMRAKMAAIRACRAAGNKARFSRGAHALLRRLVSWSLSGDGRFSIRPYSN